MNSSKKSRIVLWSILSAALVIALAFSVPAPAQESKAPAKKADEKSETIDLPAKKAEGGASKIKAPARDKDDPKFTPSAKAPAAKATRGYGDYPCTVHVENRTGVLWAKVAVDGNYRGEVAPGFRLSMGTGSGTTTIYAESSGGSYYWGPYVVNCPAYGSYTLRIY